MVMEQTQNADQNFSSSDRRTFQLWDSQSHSIETVEAKKVGAEWMGRCPKHGDKNPSLAIDESKSVFYCHACRWKGRLYDPTRKYNSLGKPVAIYIYRSVNNTPWMKVEKYIIKKNDEDRKVFHSISVGK